MKNMYFNLHLEHHEAFHWKVEEEAVLHNRNKTRGNDHSEVV